MKAIAMMFKGSCGSCNPESMSAHSDKVRGGEVIPSDSDFEGSWMCLRCATRLAKKLNKAVDTCKKNMRAGKEFRDDRWQKKRRATKNKQANALAHL
jgi:hypothetical protein